MYPSILYDERKSVQIFRDLLKYPSLRVLYPTIIGILLAEYALPIKHIIIIIAILCSVFSFFVSKFINVFNPKYTLYINIPPMIAVLCFSIINTQISKNQAVEIDTKSYHTYIGKVIEKPKDKNNFVDATLKVYDSLSKKDFLVKCYISKNQEDSIIKRGDILAFKSQIKRIENKNNPLEFKYDEYMAKNNIFHQSFIKQELFEVIGFDSSRTVKQILSDYRDYLLDIYRKFDFSENEFAIIAALTLGEKSYLSKELKSKFQNSGSMHVLAVSGLHVGILMIICNFLLSFLGRKYQFRGFKTFFTITLLWIFAGITGLSPSICRAALMFSLISLGNYLNNNNATIHTIAISCVILLVIYPHFLFEMGFLLSYFAVLSIVLILPYFEKYYKYLNPIAKYFASLFFVSIVAQIGTCGLAINSFNMFPTYFFLSGFIVIPLSFFIMIFSAALLLLSSVPYLSQIIFYALKYVTKAMIGGIDAIEKLPYSVIDDIYTNQSITICYYILLALVLIYLKSHSSKVLMFSILSALFLIIFVFALQKERMCKSTLIVYNTKQKNSAISVINNNHSKLYFMGDYLKDSSNLDRLTHDCTTFYKSNQTDTIVLDSIKYSDCFFRIKNEIFAIYDYFQMYNQEFTASTLIVNQPIKDSIEKFLEIHKIKKVILSSALSDFYKDKYSKKLDSLSIDYHNVSINGAYMIYN